MPSNQIKIINGSEHVFEIQEAAMRLTGLGLKLGPMPEALSMPYEVDFPFVTGARSPDDSIFVEVKGSYCALMALAQEMN